MGFKPRRSKTVVLTTPGMSEALLASWESKEESSGQPCEAPSSPCLQTQQEYQSPQFPAASEESENRERSDTADLQRHLKSRDEGMKTWVDGRMLPALPWLLTRSKSWCEAEQRLESPDLAEARSMRQPGGFRRDHLGRQAEISGIPRSQQPAKWNNPMVSFINNYASVTHLYDFMADDCFTHAGSFARSDSASAQNKLSTAGTVFAIFKANIGLIVIMMPGGWKCGGWLLSTIMCPLVSSISVLCGLRLIAVRSQRSGSYGDLMHVSFGRAGRVAINSSVVLVLLGTICGYLNTISQLLRAAVCPDVAGPLLIVAASVALVVPGLFRKMSNLRYLNFVGATLVLSGLIIIVVYEVMTLIDHGPQWDDVVAVNEGGVFVFLGLACSAFEGTACLVPIYDATAKPSQFSTIYMCVMAVISSLLCSVGLLGYLAFGSEVETIILVNFHPGETVSIIQTAYAIGAFCTMPLFLLPSLTLLEVNLFTPMSNPPLRRKCMKNVFRMFIIALLAITSIYGAAALKNFTSMLGAVCGVPLSFVFPALVHYSLMDGISRWSRLLDCVLVCGGLVLTLIITYVNALAWGTS